MPPIWINENGHRAQTRSCPRPGCGREVPIRRYRYETTLRQSRLAALPRGSLCWMVRTWAGVDPGAGWGEWVRMVPVNGIAK